MPIDINTASELRELGAYQRRLEGMPLWRRAWENRWRLAPLSVVGAAAGTLQAVCIYLIETRRGRYGPVTDVLLWVGLSAGRVCRRIAYWQGHGHIYDAGALHLEDAQRFVDAGRDAGS